EAEFASETASAVSCDRKVQGQWQGDLLDRTRMVYAFKLGPLGVGRGSINVYGAVSEDGMLRPVFAKSDAKGLRELSEAARGEALQCEPGLEAAARRLGFAAGPLPKGVLVARAGLALALAMGPGGGEGGALATIRLLEAFAVFWKARPWERFNGDDPLPITVALGGSVSGREASVMGMGGEQFGIALYEQPGSVRRMGELVDAGKFADVHKIPAVAVTIDPEPEYAVRAVKEAFGIPGVPVPMAIRKGRAQPASREDMVALAAALEAVAQLMPGGNEGRAAAEVGTLRCEARVTIGARLASVEEPGPGPAAGAAASRVRTPRNAPCPCGSGKKYKKCHLAEDEARSSGPRALSQDEARRLAERDPFHALDDRMVNRILGLARTRWGARFDPGAALAEFGLDEESAQLLVPWCAFHYEVPDGRTALDLLDLGDTGPLSAEERDWRNAQRVACFSILEVTDVQPGKTVSVRDLLTGDKHLVHEVSGSRTLVARDVMLGRVTEFGGKAFFCGMHPRTLPPREGAEVVRELRSELGVRTKRVPLDDLRVAVDEGVLFAFWEQRVAALDRRPLPRLANTDREPILFTIDHFSVTPDARARIRDELATLPGVEVEEDGSGNWMVNFTKPGNALHSSWENTIVGTAVLHESGLRVEANSVERADRLRSLVEAACKGHLVFRAREHADPMTSPRRPARPATTPEEKDPELAAMAAEVKAAHYRAWLDEAIPALGGITPRQASKRRGKVRRELELLLTEIEHGEARLPAAERVDVADLRRELGLPIDK
ncbi:MAG TPA: SEC-C domain-containing protein, partial [Anaeromyxobacteraceae bacterium]|nr:SEC-C domain-containing protein [Anaeromyxobacteraceae bacterium]